MGEVGPLLSALVPFLQGGGVLAPIVLVMLWLQSRKPAQSRADLDEEQWDHAKMVDLRTENDQLRSHYRALELDRDRGWDAGRAMAEVAHNLWHRLANALQKLPPEQRDPMPPPVPPLEKIGGVGPDTFPARYGSG